MNSDFYLLLNLWMCLKGHSGQKLILAKTILAMQCIYAQVILDS